MTTIDMPEMKKGNEREEKIDNELKPLNPESAINDGQVVTTPEKQNGEASINFTKPAFVGMGKEELMKYANDPFWVRLRWILFVLFWLCWVAMLVGAIVIIVMAPKCAAPERRKWWETEPMVKVDDFRSLSSIDDLIDNMESNNLKTVVIKSTIDSYKRPETNKDTFSEILGVINKARDRDVNVIIGLNAISTDEFRVKSEKAEKIGYESEDFQKYKDYYIWQPGSASQNGNPTPPNNWISYRHNRSAWEYNEDRQKFVYKPDSDPVLNFRNPAVPDEFVKVLEEWLGLNVNGFMLYDVPYMFVSEDMMSEPSSNKPGSIHTEYGFWRHTKTKNLNEIGEVLLKWRESVKNIKEDAVFMLADDLDTLDPFMVNETLTIDLPRHSTVFTMPERFSISSRIYEGVTAAFNILGKYWPVWEYTTTTSLDDPVMSSLTMLLPGTVMLNHDTDLSSLKPLHTFRSYGSFLYGKSNFHLLANNTVFAYTRVQAGSPGLVVVCNPTSDNKFVNFTSIIQEKQVTIAFVSNSNSTKAELEKLKISPNIFNVSATSTYVFTY